MTTFIHTLVSSLPNRWREVDVLLENARAEEGKADTEYHDVLCRASIVLLVAHLEGFVRDCARAVLDDINKFSSFDRSPSKLKWTFCNTFVQPKDDKGHKNVAKLIQLLEGLETKFAHEPFLFEGKNEDSRNPSPAVIEKIAKNFGIDKFFSLMAASRLDDVFANGPSDIVALTDELRVHLLGNVEAFPYDVSPKEFGLDSPGAGNKGQRTLWETFLDNVLKMRHEIAHGSNRLNSTSVSEIATSKAKVVILQYAFAILLCKHAMLDATPQNSVRV